MAASRVMQQALLSRIRFMEAQIEHAGQSELLTPVDRICFSAYWTIRLSRAKRKLRKLHATAGEGFSEDTR